MFALIAWTGIFWGAFDPPTSAHRAIIQAALQHPAVDDLIIVINNHNYKTYSNPLEFRLKMMEEIVYGKNNVTICWQDEKHPKDDSTLIAKHPLCAIAGYDSYQKWTKQSSLQEREKYAAILVIAREDCLPVLYDKNASLLFIDESLKYVSSSNIKRQETEKLFLPIKAKFERYSLKQGPFQKNSSECNDNDAKDFLFSKVVCGIGSRF